MFIFNFVYVDAMNSTSNNLSEWTMHGRDLYRASWDYRTYPAVSGLNYANKSLGVLTQSSPIIYNGYLYEGIYTGKVVQLNASNISQEIARFDSGFSTEDCDSSPIILLEYLFIGCNGGLFYQLNASNISQQISNFSIGDSDTAFEFHTVVSRAGFLYVGGRDSKTLYQLNFSNLSQQISNFTISIKGFQSSPSLAGEFLYIGSQDNNLYQLNASNVSQMIANFSSGDDFYSSPLVYSNSVYALSKDNNLYQLNASNISQELARFNTQASFITMSAPTLLNNTILIPVIGKVLYQLNASNISQQIANFSGSFDLPPSVGNGFVYVGNLQGIRQLNASNISQQIAIFGAQLATSISVTPYYIYFGTWNQSIYQLNASNISNTQNAWDLPLEVTINSPVNQIYSTASYGVNISINRAGTCEYSLNAGIINNSLSSLDNLTFTTTVSGASNGDYILNAYCNDTFGIKNYAQNVSFSVAVSTSSGGSSGGGSSLLVPRNVTRLGITHIFYADRQRVPFFLESSNRTIFYLNLMNITSSGANFLLESPASNVTFTISPKESKRLDVVVPGVFNLFVEYGRSPINSVSLTMRDIVNFSILNTENISVDNLTSKPSTDNKNNSLVKENNKWKEEYSLKIYGPIIIFTPRLDLENFVSITKINQNPVISILIKFLSFFN